MVQGIRARLTYANVMATLAAFGVLAGGGAYAASKIGSNDIAKNAVKSKHVKNNALTGKDVNESTLALGLEPPLQLVGTAGQPAFNGGSGGVNCNWKNFSSD